DKRHTRRGNGRIPASDVAATVIGAAELTDSGELAVEQAADGVPVTRMGSLEIRGEGPLVVREKTHSAAPMTLDQALYEMELVGHDFYLFVDSDSKQPSVVYRRHAYDYGVIHLNADPLFEGEPGGAGGELGG
ncbi:ribosomal subunit interface protein, partial [Streptomyces sp. AA8]